MLEYFEFLIVGGVVLDEEEQFIYGNRICFFSIKVIIIDFKSFVFERIICLYFFVVFYFFICYLKIIIEV